jgi:hypothetical protein
LLNITDARILSLMHYEPKTCKDQQAFSASGIQFATESAELVPFP